MTVAGGFHITLSRLEHINRSLWQCILCVVLLHVIIIHDTTKTRPADLCNSCSTKWEKNASTFRESYFTQASRTYHTSHNIYQLDKHAQIGLARNSLWKQCNRYTRNTQRERNVVYRSLRQTCPRLFNNGSHFSAMTDCSLTHPIFCNASRKYSSAFSYLYNNNSTVATSKGGKCICKHCNLNAMWPGLVPVVLCFNYKALNVPAYKFNSSASK